MFGIADFSIDFLTDYIFITISVLSLLIAASVWLYLKTNPPLPWYIKTIMAILRLSAVFALVLALLQPVFSYTSNYERKPLITVLRDISQSMEKTEEGKKRNERIDSIFSGAAFQTLKDKVELTEYQFGNKISRENNKTETDKTAIGEVLYQVSELEIKTRPDYILLLSDGNSNSGRDAVAAAKKINSPVISINFSAGGSEFDLGISDIDYDPVVFAGEESEIKVKINWQNASGHKAVIELLESGRLKNLTEHNIIQEDGIGEFVLKYFPESSGQKVLKINLPVNPNELNKNNNHRSFSIKVLKSKLKALFAVENPDYETGFLKRYLENETKFDVDLFVIGDKSGNLRRSFPARQTVLNQYDLIILQDISPPLLNSKKQIIDSYLKDKGGAIWLMMGKNFASSPIKKWLINLLPCYPENRDDIVNKQFHLTPSESHLFHPVLRLADNQSEIRSVWGDLPPFTSLVNCIGPNENAVILASLVESGNRTAVRPAIGFLRHGPGKLLATAVLPFWKWGFVHSELSDESDKYGRFVEGVTTWLTVKDDYDPINVAPQKTVFSRGERVIFDGFAYDQGFRPIPGVSGTIRLINDSTGSEMEIDLLSKESGKLSGEFNNLQAGQYSYFVKVEKENQMLKEISGRIMIESFNLEQYDRSGNPNLLKLISENSGGSYFEYSDFDKVLEIIDMNKRVIEEKKEVVIWNKAWLMFFIIGCFSIEWIIRKMNQLL